MNKVKCYIYIRVSTVMQVDGYSLDAQRNRLEGYATYKGMEIAGVYSDEGKSGKSIEGRPEFQRMLGDIASHKDDVSYVLVFKLSRFGRNSADTLNSLQYMQDYGVNLISVEEGLDSSQTMGKIIIAILSSIAEMERENILCQTMEGRKQKAREGKWNGGFAPYGYTLKDGKLEIAEEEAEIIRIIYDKFIHTTMGLRAVADYLNRQGFKKKRRQNNSLESFSSAFVKGVLDNPVYYGKTAYGRRAKEKVPGSRSEYRTVQQEDYMLCDGIHQSIISENDWQLAQAKRKETGVPWVKKHSLEHENILTGLLKCPICGGNMYGNVNRKNKKKKDGSMYKDHFFYACKHRMAVDGHNCDYHRQWQQEQINDAVAESICMMVNTPRFEAAIREKIGARIDVSELEKELSGHQKKLRQLSGAKDRLGQQMDELDVTLPQYDRKYRDMQTRLDNLYDDISATENICAEMAARIQNVQQQKISEDNIYQFLLHFDRLYDKFTDKEKKEFMGSFIERIDIYPDKQPDGRILKSIKFRFPVFFKGQEVQELKWDNEMPLETVVLLTK